MSRKKIIKKRIIQNDPIYNNNLVAQVINKILKNGKKLLAQKIFYEAMKKIQESTKEDPIKILKIAILNITPKIEIKSRRIGGAIYKVPVEIKIERSNSLALRILIKSTRKRPGRNMILKLKNEIIDAYNNTGNSIKKKEEIHKMAEANKAFRNIRF